MQLCNRVSQATASRPQARASTGVRATVQPLRQKASIRLQQNAIQQRSLIRLQAEGTDVGSSSNPLEGLETPETAQDAINQGLMLTGAGKWEQALNVFETALNLPGTGIKRYRDKPRAASDRERMTALYNIACCHSQLNDVRSGLVALAGCMELGYADFAQIRRDPDLAALRADERFEGLLKRFEPQAGGFLGGFNLGNVFGKK